jgi:hypothetical protein
MTTGSKMKKKTVSRHSSMPASTSLAKRPQRWNSAKILSLLVSCALFLALEWTVDHVQAQNSNDKGFLDRFTYQDETVDRGDGFFDYQPPDWSDIKCDEGSKLEECEGYNYKWREGEIRMCGDQSRWNIQPNSGI